MSDLPFGEPLTAPNPDDLPPKCKRHDYRLGQWRDAQDGVSLPEWDTLSAIITCYRCGREKDAAPKPKCRRHDWVTHVPPMIGPNPGCDRVGGSLMPHVECLACGAIRDAAASRRGKNNRQRGNSIERELAKKLGMRRVGQFGGKDDISNALFAAQVKSGGAFSERQWAWLKAVPVIAGQTQLLVIADTPGPGKKRRAVVILDLDDWRDLHGAADPA